MLITDHIYKGKIYTPEAFSVFLRMEGMRAAVVIMGSGRGLAQGVGWGVTDMFKSVFSHYQHRDHHLVHSNLYFVESAP